MRCHERCIRFHLFIDLLNMLLSIVVEKLLSPLL
nr:MAG TPA: hypothetical protein [Caudoviricetes sp.]